MAWSGHRVRPDTAYDEMLQHMRHIRSSRTRAYFLVLQHMVQIERALKDIGSSLHCQPRSFLSCMDFMVEDKRILDFATRDRSYMAVGGYGDVWTKTAAASSGGGG
jgi:hypothetical protein